MNVLLEYLKPQIDYGQYSVLRTNDGNDILNSPTKPSFRSPQYWTSITSFIFVIFLYSTFFFTYHLLGSSSKPSFKRPNGTENLRCYWVFDGEHDEYVRSLAKTRLTYEDPEDEGDLPMDCASIRSRHHFPNISSSEEEALFPIAISRTVYRDYYYHELVLAALYQPQNFYCFSVDGNANDLFRKRFESLAKCFPNVLISPSKWKMQSSGYNVDHANLECIKMLRSNERKWRYLMVLQNHDFPTKTNREIVQIFKWLNGTSDIRVTKGFDNRIDKRRKWTVNSVPVFKNTSKYHHFFETHDVPITFAKGDNEMSVSRETIDFILDEINIDHLINLINRPGVYGVDELVFPTLLTMPVLNVPGHYTQECLINRRMNPYATRKSNFGIIEECYSRKFRHRICIYGIEDVREHVLKVPYINVNKLMPSFDFNAVVCQLEELHNRAYVRGYDPSYLHKQFYDRLEPVIYRRTQKCVKL